MGDLWSVVAFSVPNLMTVIITDISSEFRAIECPICDLTGSPQMARTPGPPEAPPTYEVLRAAGIARDRALLGSRIGKLRFEKKWTHHVLGQEAGGIHGSHVRAIEWGQASPSMDRFFRIARALEVASVEQLFGTMPSEELLQEDT